MKIIKNVWADIANGRNLDTYITILLSLIVAILGLLNTIPLETLLSALLGIIALSSSSLLVNRRREEELSLKFDSLNRLGSSQKTFLRQNYNRTDYPSLVRSSKKVLFWGYSFTTTIPLLRDDLEKGLQEGLEAKFILIKPHSPAADMAILGSPNEYYAEEFNNAVEVNLARLASIQAKVPNNKLDYRVANFLPPYKMIIFDPHLPYGKLVVRLASFKTQRKNFAWFEMTKEQDIDLFNYFVAQFDKIWEHSDPLDILNDTNIQNKEA